MDKTNSQMVVQSYYEKYKNNTIRGIIYLLSRGGFIIVVLIAIEQAFNLSNGNYLLKGALYLTCVISASWILSFSILDYMEMYKIKQNIKKENYQVINKNNKQYIQILNMALYIDENGQVVKTIECTDCKK